MVHRPDQARRRAAPRQGRQPVVVGLVGVDDVDRELPEHAPQRPTWAPSRQGRAVRSSDSGSDQLDPGVPDVRSRGRRPRTQANHTAWPRSLSARARSSAGSALPVHQRFATTCRIRSGVTGAPRARPRPPPRPRRPRSPGGTDGRSGTPGESRGAGRLMPERPLPGAERRGEPGVRRTEEGHRRHADRRRDVRRPAVGGDEGVELRQERGQEGRTIAADEAPDRHPGRRRAPRPRARAPRRPRAAPCRPRAPRVASPARRSAPVARASTARRPRRAGGRRVDGPPSDPPPPGGAAPPTGARGRSPASAVPRPRPRRAARAGGGTSPPRGRGPRHGRSAWVSRRSRPSAA